MEKKRNETIENALVIKNNSASIIEGVNMDKFLELNSKIRTFQEVVKNNFIEGQDYGVIPGTKKPSLLKSGAEKLLAILGLRFRPIIEKVVRTKDEVYYLIRGIAENSRGEVVAEGVGCCSSKEKKYERQNPINIENTILKMAEKRALVDVALHVGALSNIFTQDVEEIVDNTGEVIYTPEIIEEKPKKTNGKTGKSISAKQKNYLIGLMKQNNIDPDNIDFDKIGKREASQLITAFNTGEAIDLSPYWKEEKEEVPKEFQELYKIKGMTGDMNEAWQKYKELCEGDPLEQVKTELEELEL